VSFYGSVHLIERKESFNLVGPMSKTFSPRIEKKVERRHPIEQNDQITLPF